MTIETPASQSARDVIRMHLELHYLRMKADYLSCRTTVSAYVDGLAGMVALSVASGHGLREEIVEQTIADLRTAITRDLIHLANRG